MNQSEVLSLLLPGGAIQAGRQAGAGGVLPGGSGAEAFMAHLQALLAAHGPPGTALIEEADPVLPALAWPASMGSQPPAAEEALVPVLPLVEAIAERIAALLNKSAQQQPATRPTEADSPPPVAGSRTESALLPNAAVEGLARLDALRRILPEMAEELSQEAPGNAATSFRARLGDVLLELPSLRPASGPWALAARTQPAGLPQAADAAPLAMQMPDWVSASQDSESLRWLQGVLGSAGVAQWPPVLAGPSAGAEAAWVSGGAEPQSAQTVLSDGLVLTLTELAAEAGQPGQRAYLLALDGEMPDSPQIRAKLTLQAVEASLPTRLTQSGADSGIPLAATEAQPALERALVQAAAGLRSNDAPPPSDPRLTQGQAELGRPPTLLPASETPAASPRAAVLPQGLAQAAVAPAGSKPSEREAPVPVAPLGAVRVKLADAVPPAGKKVAVEPVPAKRLQAEESVGSSPARLAAQMAPPLGTGRQVGGSAQAALVNASPWPQHESPAAQIPRPAVPVVSLDPAASSTPALAPQLLQFVSPPAPPQPDYSSALSKMLGRISELVQRYRAAGDGLYNAQLELDPPALGKLIINVLVRGDNVAIQVAAVSPASREQLQAGAAQLRQGLIDSGLNVAEMRIVSFDADEGQGGAGHDSSPRQEGQGGQGGQHGNKSTPRWEPPQKVAGSA